MPDGAERIASGLNGLVRQLEVVAHNAANAQTAGFKRRVLTFEQEYQKSLEALSGNRSLRSNPIQTRQEIDFSQGRLIQTDRPLDIALEGRGFLTLQTPDGPMYTRNGCLQINALGQLTDSQGRIVAGQNGPINLPADALGGDIQISQDGVVRIGTVQVGQLRLADFGENEHRLIPSGFGVFAAPADVQPMPAAGVKVRQGYQESSNVQMIQEMVSMMTLSRLYEANMNVLRQQREASQAVLSAVNT
ncbi:MAG TPA: flagellar hook basal-body protein [Anaerohalosphaeraceae bacterium]|nr:flagellar hook basal-body protein [Anaerohalosphaeraceae bacterium]